MKSPIFIFSLPRAGSTLLQRILMSHKNISSISEPWILLPQIYATKNKGTLSEYSSLTSQVGINDFIENLPNKKESYINAQRKFLIELYSMQCQNNEKYFLDKTPRYYLIIDEIVELFPNAKFIFLFRNPVQVFASIVNTWGKGRFRNIISTYDDLIKGTKRLSEAYLKHKEISYSLQYEDLILNLNEKLSEISNYLDIPLQKGLETNFSSQDTIGALGDSTGVEKYNSISQEGLIGWKKVFNSFYRKRIIYSL
ncbi:MAG: sulfotransferase, partial [Flavobacteriaceae bacterium]|nr:sulfotransferase [Flavobacteriaceae bacterium]